MLCYVAFSPSNHYEACFISIIWNRPILQLAVQSLTRAFCSWPSYWGSVDWLVIRGVWLGRWCHLLLFAWCSYSGCLLWWFFFSFWRSCWSSLQNVQKFAIEIYKVLHGFSPPILNDIFVPVSRQYNFRRNDTLQRRRVNSVRYGTESNSFLGPNIWELVPSDIKLSQSLSIFK